MTQPTRPTIDAPSDESLATKISRRAILGAPVIGVVSMITRSHMGSLAQETLPGTVAVFPRQGTRTASPGTEISFRGPAAAELGTVIVTGDKSGGHSGVIFPHADDMGVSFVPDAPFLPGEIVTVHGEISLNSTIDGSLSFTVAHPALPPEIPSSREPSDRETPTQSFRSRTDLRPPVITVTTAEQGTAPGYVFTGVKTQDSQNGPAIIDDAGELIWFSPLGLDIGSVNDVRVQEYQGQPVITWWEGVSHLGQGLGHFVIMDQTYQQIATVQAGNGYPGADLHEFVLTPRGTAFMVIYNPVRWDLSTVGGSLLGAALDSIVQEVEVESGRVLFEWHSLDHVDLAESVVEPPADVTQAFDYVHVNSIELDANGDLMLSARNTSAVYKVSGLSGEIMWRLNGTHGDFARAADTETAFHHDARLQANGNLTLFDNAASDEDADEQSRGVEISINTESMTATLVREYQHPTNILSVSQGNMQVLPNGNVFIGWGSAPVFSEFDPGGALLFNGRFPRMVNSYRAYRFAWAGSPAETPAIFVERRSPGVVTVFASWNGATEVANWRVLAGPAPDQLQTVEVALRTGFETRMTIQTAAVYFAAQAEDSTGQVLDISLVVMPEG